MVLLLYVCFYIWNLVTIFCSCCNTATPFSTVFCGLKNLLSTWHQHESEQIMTEFSFWVNYSFNSWRFVFLLYHVQKTHTNIHPRTSIIFYHVVIFLAPPQGRGWFAWVVKLNVIELTMRVKWGWLDDVISSQERKHVIFKQQLHREETIYRKQGLTKPCCVTACSNHSAINCSPPHILNILFEFWPRASTSMSCLLPPWPQITPTLIPLFIFFD